MTATPDRTTVIIYSTIQSTPSSTQSNATSSSSSGSGKKGNFTGIAVGGAIGGFAMTVLLTAGLWWMWKRRNPWWNATPQDVPDGSAIASSTAKFDEEKANRSLPSRPSTSSANHSSTPKTYEVSEQPFTIKPRGALQNVNTAALFSMGCMACPITKSL